MGTVLLAGATIRPKMYKCTGMLVKLEQSSESTADWAVDMFRCDKRLLKSSPLRTTVQKCVAMRVFNLRRVRINEKTYNHDQ